MDKGRCTSSQLLLNMLAIVSIHFPLILNHVVFHNKQTHTHTHIQKATSPVHHHALTHKQDIDCARAFSPNAERLFVSIFTLKLFLGNQPWDSQLNLDLCSMDRLNKHKRNTNSYYSWEGLSPFKHSLWKSSKGEGCGAYSYSHSSRWSVCLVL